MVDERPEERRERLIAEIQAASAAGNESRRQELYAELEALLSKQDGRQ